MFEKEYKVTGQNVKATFTEEEITKIFIPLLSHLIKMREDKGGRLVVFLAGSPGTGKTTLSLFLEELFDKLGSSYTFQSVSMDGFHHYNDYLDSHSISKNGEEVVLRKLKGIPESFNFHQLKSKLKELRQKEVVAWPTYDRALHNVSEETISVDGDIILVEGNYLLLKQEPWKELKEFSDYSVMIDTDLKFIEDRLVSRKQRGGSTLEESELHYQQIDKVNAELVLQKSEPGDLTLYLIEEGFRQK